MQVQRMRMIVGSQNWLNNKKIFTIFELKKKNVQVRYNLHGGGEL